MTAIDLYIDVARVLNPGPDWVVVDGIEDYVNAYAKLATALHAGSPLTILVRHSVCSAWLGEAARRYTPSRVGIQEITRRGRLADLWGLSVPEWVSEQDIERSGLLKLPPLSAKPGQAFEDVILEAFYSPFLAYSRLPLSHVTDLLESCAADAWAKADSRPVLAEARRRRFADWAKNASSEQEKWLVGQLETRPLVLRDLLFQYRVVQDYPMEVGERLLGADFPRLQALKLELGSLRVSDGEVPGAVDQIEVHLHGLMASGLPTERFQLVLQQMSGCLFAEFNWVESVLRQSTVKADRRMLDQIRAVFRPLRDQMSSRLADLSLLVEPNRPTAPSSEWAVDRWLEWARREYLPYRFWLEEVAKVDTEVAKMAEAFGDWLYEQAPALVTSFPRMVYRAIQNSEVYLGEDHVLLFIFMDNFNYKFFPDFQMLMSTRGFSCQASKPYLSLLPSATEVSKKAMAVGQPSPFPTESYAKPVEDTWSAYFSPRRVKYLPNIGDLQGVSQREHDIYILNYLPVDTALHNDTRLTGVTHAQDVRQHLRNLVNTIHEFALRLRIERKLRVVVCADHGSTKIPADVPNIIDRAFYTGRVTDKHHRYVSISDQEMDALPKNVQFQCYFITRSRFQLDSNYLAARGYYRFVKTDESYYVHGGLTPEETIVPYAMFERIALKLKQPTLRLLANEFRYSVKSRVHLEVVNPNEQSLYELRVEIRTPGVTAPSETPAELHNQEVAILTIEDARFSRSEGEIRQLEVMLSYEFAGQGYQQSSTFPVTMKSMMQTKIDLDLDDPK